MITSATSALARRAKLKDLQKAWEDATAEANSSSCLTSWPDRRNNGGEGMNAFTTTTRPLQLFIPIESRRVVGYLESETLSNPVLREFYKSATWSWKSAA